MCGLKLLILPTTNNDLLIDNDRRMFLYFSGKFKDIGILTDTIAEFATEKAAELGVQSQKDAL